jgi:benzylsuccinate CoA-transferase BbsF subunit
VLELGFGVAAPFLTRHLAHFGADVVRVESRAHPDSLRQVGAGWVPLDFDPGVRGDTSPSLNASAAEKRSVGLEIDDPRGRAAFAALVRSADVFVTNLRVGALHDLGIGYDDIRALRPDVVYVALTSFGSDSGPYRDHRTWGPNLAAQTGLDQLVGWPDRAPGALPLSYPDYAAAFHGAVATLAAVLHRDLTGEGQYVELSQFEVTASCLGPLLAAYLRDGTVAGRTGNRRAGWAPHGLYATRDAQRWVAIAVGDEATWTAFCGATGLERCLDDPRFASPPARTQPAAQDELDALVTSWTSARTAAEAVAELQRAGVPAAPVVDPFDLVADEHLAAREFWKVLPHLRFGRDLVQGHAVDVQGVERSFTRASPALGEHTREVLAAVGLSPSEVDDLVAAGIAHEPARPDLTLERPYVGWVRLLMRLPWPDTSLSLQALAMERLARTVEEP